MAQAYPNFGFFGLMARILYGRGTTNLIEGKEILIAPNSLSEGVTVAMILDSGAPVELLEFRRDLSSGSTR
jgi:hypothetical protein